jgi:hypothetical protein
MCLNREGGKTVITELATCNSLLLVWFPVPLPLNFDSRHLTRLSSSLLSLYLFTAVYTMITLFFATMTDPKARLKNSSSSVGTTD